MAAPSQNGQVGFDFQWEGGGAQNHSSNSPNTASACGYEVRAVRACELSWKMSRQAVVKRRRVMIIVMSVTPLAYGSRCRAPLRHLTTTFSALPRLFSSYFPSPSPSPSPCSLSFSSPFNNPKLSTGLCLFLPMEVLGLFLFHLHLLLNRFFFLFFF